MIGWTAPLNAGRHHATSLAAGIAEAIWVGDLAVGERVAPERELAARLGLSRPTVRAALRECRVAGLLEVRHGRAGGSFVSTDLVAEHLLPAPPEPAPSVPELLEARRGIELLIARLAALHATGADLEALAATVARQRAAAGDWDVSLQLDVRFHLQLARAGHNSMMWLVARTLQRHVWRARLRALRTPHDPVVVAGIHDRTLAAIAARDVARVDRVMDEHLGWLERAWAREPLPQDTRRCSRLAAGPGAR